MNIRNILIGLALLLAIIPGRSSAQETKQQNEKIKPVLLVIDIQNAFLPMMDIKEKDGVLANINGYIELFRSHGWPIIRVYHSSKEYGVEPGTEGFEFPASVSIKPEDAKVIKTYPDGFNKTDLDKVIREKGSNTLFLCGLSSVGCVLATWFGAMNNDYKAFLIKDAIVSHNADYTNNVELMFEAVGYDVVKLIVESAEK